MAKQGEVAPGKIFASEAEMKAIRDQVDVYFEQAREALEAGGGN